MAKITESFEKVMDYSNDDTQIEQLSLNTQQSVFSHINTDIIIKNCMQSYILPLEINIVNLQ